MLFDLNDKSMFIRRYYIANQQNIYQQKQLLEKYKKNIVHSCLQ